MKAVAFVPLLLGSLVPAFAAEPDRLPIRTVEIPRDWANHSLPRFQNGLVLACERSRAAIWAYHHAGKRLVNVPVSAPGAAATRIRDVAAFPGGTMAAIASAVDERGGAVQAIYWLSPAGAVTRALRTDPYLPLQIHPAPDGTLWAAGRVRDSNLDDVPEYDVLRQYDAQGRLLRTALPRSLLPPKIPELYSYHSFLVGAGDRIGYYFVEGNTYFELKPSGEIAGKWNIAPPPAEAQLLGCAMAADGDVYLSGQKRRDRNDISDWRLLLYRLDKPAGVLRPIDFDRNGALRSMLLIGCDGDQLVFYTRMPMSVEWFVKP
jgi:hypothetical protein